MIKKILYSLILFAPIIAIVFFYSSYKTYIDDKNFNQLSNYKCLDCNIVLISVDTLRADHLSTYGYKINTTPNINNFFNNSVYFKKATSASSWTLPSTMSIMTGLIPNNHKVTNRYQINNSNENDLLNMHIGENTDTIAKILKDYNYATGGFTGGAGVDDSFGFNKGFDEYYDEENFGGFNKSINKALAWAKQNNNNKMFIFLHGYDIHGQFPTNYDKRFVKNYQGKLNGSIEEQKSLREEGLFNGKISLTKDDVNFLIALYDEKIQRMDKELNYFFEEYSKLTNKKTIFILTSDHGEEFYEHGQIDHGHSLYNELINIPLIIKLPGLDKNIYLNSQVSSIDILPTIISLTKIDYKKNLDGQNLFINNSNRKIISESEYRYVVNLKSSKNKNWKLIYDLEKNKKYLFNTFFDKLEKTNLYQKIEEINKKFFKITDLNLDL